MQPKKWFNRVCDVGFAALVNEYVPPGLKPHVFLMRVMGLLPSANTSSPLYKCLTLTTLISLGIFYPLSLFVNLFYANSIQDVIDQAFISLTSWTVAFKAAVIYQQRDHIRQLFQIDADLSRECDRPKAAHVARINSIAYVFHTVAYTMTSFMFLVQVFVIGPEKSPYPSTARMPYAFAANRNVFWVGMTLQTVSYLVLCVLAAMEDSLYIALINIICGHVAEMKDRLKMMGMKGAADADRNSLFFADLRECCRRYEDCLSFVQNLEKIMSNAYFVQFGTSSLVLCSNVYLISVSDAVNNALKSVNFSVYLMCIIAQISLNCYLGSRLTAASEGITNAIYESQWMDCNEMCKRAMRILVERSMRPMVIYAGGLFELSLPTFVQICKAAFSYFNLLRTLDSKIT